jgi:hypothetical protein
VQAPETAIDGTLSHPVCNRRSHTFGSNGDIGTPGGRNETCFPYRLDPVPVDYEDISATGTAELLFGSQLDEDEAILNLASYPFPIFGTPVQTLILSANGFVVNGPTSTHATPTNKAFPSSNTNFGPVGAIAPFWDDLQASGFPDANVYFQRMPASKGRPGHWIVQWQHVTRKVTPMDDLNFQVKLFDDGTIEFHFATMNGTRTGISATSWLESPAGDLALPVGINSDFMTSNVAWRYTPIPPVTP